MDTAQTEQERRDTATVRAGFWPKIKQVARVMQNPPPGQRAPAQLCFPSGLSDDGLVGEVTHWIDEQVPSLDNKDEFDAIAAALNALYSCGGIRGSEGD